MTTQGPPIITFEHVYFAYQDEPVLRDVSFQVNPGELIGLIGPNGGGKTTLLKLIMGFIRPQKGSLMVFGKPPSISQGQIAYVPQNLHYDRQFPISVLELVLSGRLSRLPWYGVYSREDYQAAYDALDQVGMRAFQNHAFGNLSGGQAQRALIARALVSNPKLLLLDEPTASVDPQAVADIFRILKELHGKMTIMMVTHDLNVAIDMMERVLCVQGGVISLFPQEICEHFALGLYHIPLQIGINKHGKTFPR